MMLKLVLVGDSIRMSYQPFVRKALTDACDVWGPAENCESSRTVLAHLDRWVLARDADVIHINCGLHDLRHDPGTSGPQVPPEEYRANVREILTRAAATGATLIWATTTPVSEAVHNSYKESRRYSSDVEVYNRIAREVATGRGVPVNDLHGVVVRHPEPLWSDDGVHFESEGYRLLGGAVAEFVRAALPR